MSLMDVLRKHWGTHRGRAGFDVSSAERKGKTPPSERGRGKNSPPVSPARVNARARERRDMRVPFRDSNLSKNIKKIEILAYKTQETPINIHLTSRFGVHEVDTSCRRWGSVSTWKTARFPTLPFGCMKECLSSARDGKTIAGVPKCRQQHYQDQNRGTLRRRLCPRQGIPPKTGKLIPKEA